MTDRARERLETLVGEVKNQERYLATARTKDEALNHARLAAEFSFRAFELSAEKNEKADLKAKFETYLDRAERIKAANCWPLLTSGSILVNDSISPQSGNAFDDLSKVAANEPLPRAFVNKLTIGENSSLTKTISQPTHDIPIRASRSSSPPASKVEDSPLLLSDLSLEPRSLSLEKLDSIPPNGNALTYALFDVEHEVIVSSQVSALPSVQHTARLVDLKHQGNGSAPSMDVKPLKEPISSRTLTKKEQIILLKASRVNGFVFPPWKESPGPSEFVLENQAEPYLDAAELKLSSHQMDHFLSWARAKDALPPPSWFPGDRQNLVPTMRASRSVDLVQDAATDCSVVASLCAGIARTKRGHDSVFYPILWPRDQPSKRPKISPNGKYIVRLNFNGCWRKVIIDDRLPLSKTNRTLHVVDRKNSGLLWPALLEKAYLKVRGGYDFPGSNSCSDLWALTGWIPEQIYLQEGDLVPSQLWTRLYAAFLYGDVLVTLGTGKMAHRAERELGLEGQHSYVVLDMKETDQEKAFLVKNPWLDGKGWRGRRPSLDFLMEDSSPGGTYPRSIEATKSNAKNNPYPSTFWIGLDSVVQHFESLYLNWNTGLFSHRQDIHFSWDLAESSTAPGSVADHPQFSFTSDVGGIIWLVLSRHFRDTAVDAHDQSDAFNDGTVRSNQDKPTGDDPLKGYMNIYIYDRQGVRVFIKDNYIERGQYVNTPQSLLRWQCEPKSTYTLVIDQEDLLPSLYTFTLSAFSSSTIRLEQAWKKYPLEKRISGRWTTETAGGNTHSTKYFDNPQYSLTIGHHTPLAILIQTRDGRHPVHVKLVHGHGKRIHSIQSRNILVDSGEHRDGCALAEVHDAPPGTYTIICSMFEADQTEEFSLTVYSVSECHIRPIPRDGAGMVSTRLTDACFNSLVNKVAAPLVPRRIAGLTVIVKFLYARTTNTTAALGKDVKNRSPLRVLIETGRGPQKKTVASSDNGEFSDAGTVRIQSVDLRPDMLYDGDIWLVLERLTTPGSAIEERFTVEVLADAPQAFSAGLWRIWED